MHIHFVCSGNTNRSRMAEAYLKSKNLPGITVSSSGIYASHNRNGSLSRYARRVLIETGLLPYAAPGWQQATREIIENADLVIFMTDKQYEFCRNTLHAIPKKYLVWNIIDVETDLFRFLPFLNRKKIMADTEIFNAIKKHIDNLIADLNL